MYGELTGLFVIFQYFPGNGGLASRKSCGLVKTILITRILIWLNFFYPGSLMKDNIHGSFSYVSSAIDVACVIPLIFH